MKQYYLMIDYENEQIFIFNQHEYDENKNITIQMKMSDRDIIQVLNFGRFISKKLQYNFNQQYKTN